MADDAIHAAELCLAQGRPERAVSMVAPLLAFYLMEKAVYELRYELNNRPEWVGIPLEGILEHIR